MPVVFYINFDRRCYEEVAAKSDSSPFGSFARSDIVPHIRPILLLQELEIVANTDNFGIFGAVHVFAYNFL